MTPARARLLRVAAKAFEIAAVTAAVAASAIVSAAAGAAAGDDSLIRSAEQSLSGLRGASKPPSPAPPIRQAPGQGIDDFVNLPPACPPTSAATETPDEERRRIARERKRAARARAKELAEPEIAPAAQAVFPWGEDMSRDAVDTSGTCPGTAYSPLSTDLKSTKKRERGVADTVREDMSITPECASLFDAECASAGVTVDVDPIWSTFCGYYAGKRWGPSMIRQQWRKWVAKEHAIHRPPPSATSEPPPSTVRPTLVSGLRETRSLLEERERWEREELDRESAMRAARDAMRTLERTGT